MKLTKRTIIYWILGILVLSFVIKSIIDLSLAMNQQIPVSESAVQEYLNLFPTKEKLLFTNVWNYNNSDRNQFSLFDYGSEKKYCLLVYKIPIDGGFTLDRITTNNFRKRKAYSGTYIAINENYTEFNYSSGRPAKADDINFSFLNGIFKLINSNDSMISYYYYGNQFAFILNGASKPDIYGGGKNNLDNLPFNITFIKKQQLMYLVIMTVNNSGDTLKSTELNNIFLN